MVEVTSSQRLAPTADSTGGSVPARFAALPAEPPALKTAVTPGPEMQLNVFGFMRCCSGEVLGALQWRAEALLVWMRVTQRPLTSRCLAVARSCSKTSVRCSCSSSWLDRACIALLAAAAAPEAAGASAAAFKALFSAVAAARASPFVANSCCNLSDRERACCSSSSSSLICFASAGNKNVSGQGTVCHRKAEPSATSLLQSRTTFPPRPRR